MTDKTEQFKKFVVTNTKTGEKFHVQSPSVEKAKIIFCGDKQGWKNGDCKVEEEK